MTVHVQQLHIITVNKNLDTTQVTTINSNKVTYCNHNNIIALFTSWHPAFMIYVVQCIK